MEIKTRPDIGRALASSDNVVIDTGTDLVSASPDRFMLVGVRTITADATLASTDRVVIIDSADATISVTLDAGSATRAPVEILWPGDATAVRTLTLIRNGGSGTIDGASASRTISAYSSHALRVRAFATGANEWHTETDSTPSDFLFVSGTSATVGADDLGGTITNTAAIVNADLPVGVLGRRVVLVRGLASAYDITVTPATGETVNGVGGASVLPGSANAPAGSFWVLEYVNLVGIGETWGLYSSAGAIAALTTRIAALEAIATTSLSSTTGTTLSWEAQERVRLANTGTTHCTVTLNGDTDEWPVGRARAISQYGSTTGGFTLAVPSGHKLNTVTNGTSGVIGTSAADDGTALFTVMVTREASDEWSWA